ncbi:hypothetical protein [Streptomyces sp. R08]|uniref:Uncharacterized protein n=1 Tax=Streptomyces sp. R08 TaxID=3238624 RepID=A0AB39MAI5_9ACTN
MTTTVHAPLPTGTHTPRALPGRDCATTTASHHELDTAALPARPEVTP